MKCPICDGIGTSNTCVNGTFKPCSFCNGTGEVMTDDVKIRCDDCKFVENCVDYGWKDCKKFTPKQSESMTNEEWLKSLSTEELANYIATQCADVIRLWREMQYWTANEKCKSNKWYVWLKEIHNE